MSNPIKEFRNFKNNRSNHLHHARAEEAQVEVTIETESETLTCEINTMQNNNTNNVEQIRPTAASDVNIDGVKAEMNTLSGAIKEVLDNPTPAAEEINMEQTETISITSVTDRYKKLRRNAIISNVAGNIASVAGMTLGAAANGRDVKRAAVIAGILGGASMGWMLTSRLQKSIAQSQANHLDEETYQTVAENKPSDVIKGGIGSFVVGGLIGAFFVRKVTTGE